MPTRNHEIWLERIKERPALAAELLEWVYPDGLPAFGQARLEPGDLNDHKPTEYRADAVVTLLSGTRMRAAVIVEIQRARDTRKQWTWPVYLATLRARLQCPVLLLVICEDRSHVAWCRTPIDFGHPGLVLTPLVLGPDEVPAMIDPGQAAANLDLAMLSAVVHGADPDGGKVLAALVDAADSADPERAKNYIDEVMAVLPAAARRLLEAMVTTGTHEYKSDFARRYYGQGKAEGKAEGEGAAILTVLEERGIAVPDGVRDRIAGCDDLDQLTLWLRRAVTVARAEDLFA